mgnify:CR=1 FL=1
MELGVELRLRDVERGQRALHRTPVDAHLGVTADRVLERALEEFRRQGDRALMDGVTVDLDADSITENTRAS